MLKTGEMLKMFKMLEAVFLSLYPFLASLSLSFSLYLFLNGTMRQRNKKTMCTRLGLTFFGFRGLNLHVLWVSAWNFGLEPPGLVPGVRPVWL